MPSLFRLKDNFTTHHQNGGKNNHAIICTQYPLRFVLIKVNKPLIMIQIVKLWRCKISSDLKEGNSNRNF